MKKILKGVTSDKHHQHNKLMDEFKKAHRKMFKPTNEDKEAPSGPHLNTGTSVSYLNVVVFLVKAITDDVLKDLQH